MKRGVKTIIVGVSLFVLGGVVIPLIIIVPLFLGDSVNEQFIVPGSIQVAVKEPGRYYLWNNYQTVFDGRSYNRSEELPDGMNIRFTNAETGEPFAFIASSSISMSSGSSAKRSIGYIEVQKPCRIALDITGESDQGVFSFSRAVFFEMLKQICGSIALSVVAGFTGIGCTIWSVVRLTQAKEQAEQNQPKNEDISHS
ncbi:MAG: hypothetical protein ACL93V_04015 [Candidatus Electrothrix sp. YB6]